MATKVDSFLSNVNTSDTHLVGSLLAYICQNFASRNATMASMCKGYQHHQQRQQQQGDHQHNLSPQTNDLHLQRLLEGSIEIPSTHKILLTSALVVILVTAAVGNALVLVSIVFHRTRWTNMHVSILSLAVSDIVFSMTCIPLSIDQTINVAWTFGAISCKSLPFFNQLAISANMLTLCCMAADRFFAILYPLKCTAFRTIKTTQTLILMSWLVSIAAALPQPVYFDVKNVCGQLDHDGQCKNQSLHSFCMVQHTSSALIPYWSQRWILFSFLFLCPAIVMGVSYGIIIHTLWVKAAVGTVVMSSASTRNRYKKKSVTILVCVMCSFLLCWAPFQIWVLVSLGQHIEFTSTTKTVDLYLKSLALSSTSYNPIIYAFMNQRFRADFRNILLRRRCLRVAPQVLNNKENNNIHCIQRELPGIRWSPVVSNNTTALQGLPPMNGSSKFTTSTRLSEKSK